MALIKAISMNFSVLMISGFAALTSAIRIKAARKRTSPIKNSFLFFVIQARKSALSVLCKTARLIPARMKSAVTCDARSFCIRRRVVSHQKIAPQSSIPKGRSKKTPFEGSFFIPAYASGRLSAASNRLNKYQLITPIMLT